MQTRQSVSLRDRILSLEYRVRNFEYARKWFQDLRRNAEASEVEHYDAAVARSEAAIDALKTELRNAKRQLASANAPWPEAPKMAA